MLPRSLAVPCIAALLVSCGEDAAPTSLVPTDYLTRFTEVRDCRQTNDHIRATTVPPMASHIRVLIDPEAARAYTMNAARLPVGTLVIKQEFDDASCSAASLRAWSVMRKEAPGYDATHNDWRWQRVRASDGGVIVDGRVAQCSGCHSSAACTSRDWVCTEP